MQPMKALLALYLLVAIAAASGNSTGYQAGAKLFGYQMVSPGIGFSVENFTCGGKTAYAIVSYDEPAAFFTLSEAQGADFPGIRPTTEAGAIADALYCYHAENGHTPNLTEGFTKTHSEIAKLQDDDDRGEAGCRILLGTDTRECTSFESCQRACYSVTSFCQPVALGAGRAFVSEIWAFENNSHALDAAYSEEEKAYAAFAENASERAARGYLGAINRTFTAAEQAAMNPLFYDYSFCFSPDYPIYSLYLLKMRAERQYQDSAVFYGIGARSREIAALTATAMEKKAKYRLPEIGGNATAGTGGEKRGDRTLGYDEETGQAQSPSFISGFINWLFSFFLGWAQQK